MLVIRKPTPHPVVEYWTIAIILINDQLVDTFKGNNLMNWDSGPEEITLKDCHVNHFAVCCFFWPRCKHAWLDGEIIGSMSTSLVNLSTNFVRTFINATNLLCCENKQHFVIWVVAVQQLQTVAVWSIYVTYIYVYVNYMLMLATGRTPAQFKWSNFLLSLSPPLLAIHISNREILTALCQDW